MSDDVCMTSPTPSNMPIIPCPLCDSCDHDIRGGLLELAANIKSNFDTAMNSLLDAIECDGEAVNEFVRASIELASVREQMIALEHIVPDMFAIKKVVSE